RLAHLLCGGGEILPSGGHVDAELFESRAVVGQRLRSGVLGDSVGLSVEACLAPDAFAELWLDVLDVLADLGGNACDDHRRQRGVLDEGDVRSVSCSSGGDEFVGRVVTAAGIGMADLDVGMRRVP